MPIEEAVGTAVDECIKEVTVPDDLRETILAATDMDVLKNWLMLAVKAASVEEFVQGMTKQMK